MDIPESTLPEFLLAAAAERADEPALIDGPTGRVTTYGELAAGVRRLPGPVPTHRLLLVLDGAHRADEPSQQVLAHLARRVAELPVGSTSATPAR